MTTRKTQLKSYDIKNACITAYVMRQIRSNENDIRFNQYSEKKNVKVQKCNVNPKQIHGQPYY